MNFYYLKFLKGNNLISLFVSRSLKMNNFKLFVFNKISDDLNNLNSLKSFKIKNFYLSSNLFELNRLEFNLKFNRNNFQNFNLKYINFVLEDNMFINKFLYKKLLNKFIFNIFCGSHYICNLDLSIFKIFDFILPLSLFLENEMSSINVYGILQRSYRINNWFKNSKSFNYLLKFIILNLGIKYNKIFLLDTKNKIYLKIKNTRIIKDLNTLKKKKNLNWFSQNMFKNIYIINNITNSSKNLVKGSLSLKVKNFN